jgi:menaquinone-dependent protoporphyrinogen oxidase
MKILIAYGTKSGTTEDCAKEIKEKLGKNVDVINLKKVKNIDINNYDWLILGTPIYAGMIDKNVKKFILNNEANLESKLLGLYTCGLGDAKESYDAVAKVTSIISASKVYKHLGGEMHPERQKGLLKLIAKQMAKSDACNKKRDKGVVDEFVKEINSFLVN